MIEYADIISRLEKLIEDFAENVCVSCERLCQRKNVSCIELSEGAISSDVWLRLLAYVICTNPEANSKQLYICNYCKPRIRSNELPCRFVLNGLQTISVPPELNKLDALSAELIQRAKCYQTILRRGTYTGKVSIYNSLKACKGTMFFLPLLNQVESSKIALPDPELYIIVNGKPTKNKVVWRTLVDVNRVKSAVDKLKQINWLYKDVSDDDIDDSTKQVIEVVNSTTSTVLQKADESDIVGLQAYTVRISCLLIQTLTSTG